MIERRSLGFAIQGVSRLLELDPVEQPLNMAGEGVGGHDDGGVERMNVLGPDFTDQRSDLGARCLHIEDSEPDGEHDFGLFDHAISSRISWKIDYYNADLTGRSSNPADPAVICRGLTNPHTFDCSTRIRSKDDDRLLKRLHRIKQDNDVARRVEGFSDAFMCIAIFVR